MALVSSASSVLVKNNTESIPPKKRVIKKVIKNRKRKIPYTNTKLHYPAVFLGYPYSVWHCHLPNLQDCNTVFNDTTPQTLFPNKYPFCETGGRHHVLCAHSKSFNTISRGEGGKT